MLAAAAAPDPSRRLLAMSGRLTNGRRSELYRALSRTRRWDGAYAAVEQARSGLDGDPSA